MSTLWQDLRLAIRGHRKQPGVTIVAVLVLALGIVANTAIYTLVDAVALRPLPVLRPAELYRLGDVNTCCVNTGLQKDTALFSFPAYQFLRDRLPEFTGLAAFQANATGFSVRREGAGASAQPIIGEFVSGNYFGTFGVPMAAGRGLIDDDDRAGAGAVAVISYRAWRDRYGLDPSVVGATFVVSGAPVTIVGIAAPGFFGDTLRPNPPDIWMPLGIEPLVHGIRQGIVAANGTGTSLLARPDQNWLYIVGRMRQGIAFAMVQEKVSALLRAWLSEQPFLSPGERAQVPDQYVAISSAATGVSTLRTRYADALRVLAVVSAMVLLIACANLASLLLARTQPFQVALRAALGASRRRLIREMLTSGILLALVGGLAGVAIAFAGTKAIVAMTFRGASYVPIDAAPSLGILAFAAAMSLLAGIVFTATPAWIMSKANPMEALRGGGRSTRDRSTLPRQVLVIVQVSISLVLIVGAGLLTRSLMRLEGQQFGFETGGRLIVHVDPSLAGYTIDRLPSLYERLYAELPRVPGVARVSLSQYSPMEGNNWSGGISLEGKPTDASHRYSSSWLRVGPYYFDTVGTPMLRGRPIDERDTAGSLHVAVVNRTFARKFYPGEEPIGRHIGLGEEPGHDMDYEIVGVADDAKYVKADEAAWPTFFIPLLQTVPYRVEGLISMQARSLFIRDIELRVVDGSGRLETVASRVRGALAEIDPDLPVTAIVTFDEQLARNFNQQRLVARLTALYGQLALLLAMIGLYGITAIHVARRTAEIAIRMALGADRGRVLTMVLGRALAQTGIGLAIGMPAAFLAGRALSSQLYGVGAQDPVVLMVAVAALAGSAIVAALIPARRAASIDPIEALRAE